MTKLPFRGRLKKMTQHRKPPDDPPLAPIISKDDRRERIEAICRQAELEMAVTEAIEELKNASANRTD